MNLHFNVKKPIVSTEDKLSKKGDIDDFIFNCQEWHISEK